MYLCSTLSIFIWFSFLYRDLDCAQFHTSTGQLTRNQQQELYNELKSLDPQRRKQLFGDLERQRQEFELSSSKWARLRETQIDDSSFVSQADVDNIRTTIQNGGSPVVRNKRTLKFLVKSLAEIMGLRLTLLKYSLIPGVVNAVIGPAPASPAPPARPAPPNGPAPPPPKNPAPRPPPPPPKKPPPPPAPAPKQPPPAPTAPAPPPPTIPQNQIDPNTIRYPFRPAPTIPFLTFAPLPPGVTVPYPPLFQWPSPQPAMPTQPPCAAPPPAAPKNPPPPQKPPSRLPLPKPRPPVPPPPPPIKPVLPASPGKTPLKLEYDHPVRIEIFNNVKPYLPVSGSVYSGEPSLTSLEEKDEQENYLNPTQAIQEIDDHYSNTENSQQFNEDEDYGFLTKVPKYFSQVSTQKYSDYDHTEKIRDYDEDHDHYEDNDHIEETTPADRHNSFFKHDAFSDYPEHAEENRANVNVHIRHTDEKLEPPKKPRKLRKERKPLYSSNQNIQSVFNRSASSPSWKAQSFPAYSTETYPTSKFPKNHAPTWRNGPRKLIRRKSKIELTTAKNDFRIVVPDFSNRKRRDLLFAEAFKDFNFSAFDSFKKEKAPDPIEAQFLESPDGKLIPNLNYRKKLEKDIESYVEKYVEQQISRGHIDVTKPKTTIIELKPKEGPPIKTVTTTLSKIVDGDKPFIESILEYSKGINPVSDIGELSGVEEPSPAAEKSVVGKAFENESFDSPFSWNQSSLG